VRIDLFDYELPGERIAQTARPRGSSRLLTLDRTTGAIAHRSFHDFPDLLRAGDLLVRNDVRVRKARLYGRDEKDRVVEIFLLRGDAADPRRWAALARPGRRAKKGRLLRFGEDLTATVDEVEADGRRRVTFGRAVDDSLLERIGNVPLPPYIRRAAGTPDFPADREAYQTIYAREPLAVAAPTAGLHFTSSVLERIAARGCRIADLTLAVGAGTFKPVTSEDTAGHRLDAEEARIPPVTLRLVAETKGARRARHRRRDDGHAGSGGGGARRTRPRSRRSRFLDGPLHHARLRVPCGGRVVDELPPAALDTPHAGVRFGGRERVLAAYEEAVREKYLFYSYGDAMFMS
jgi:S-adenosylmethionine:tRNA ribosyltransferase-isomerase